jgi:HTH-type transcriptional regulator/antitoxin HigA
MTDNSEWTPDWAVMPGEVLSEALQERSMTQAELARRMARPVKTISEIVTGKTAITADTAIQLERTLGISARIWLGLESHYRELQARSRDRAALRSHTSWLREFPVGDLVRRGILTRGASKEDQASELLSYFGVSSPEGWHQQWGQFAASYRMSKGARVSTHSVSLWLRQAESDVEDIDLPEFSVDGLRAAGLDLRELTRLRVLGAAVIRAQETLRQAGVGFIIADGVVGAPASGAVMKVRKNPWIVLTLRFHTADQFWFSLFHEIGHILEGNRRLELVEYLDDIGEREQNEEFANSYARETLIPQQLLEAWLADHRPDVSSVLAFADEIGVAPGIVVGRLQRERIVRWSSTLRVLKQDV